MQSPGSDPGLFHCGWNRSPGERSDTREVVPHIAALMRATVRTVGWVERSDTHPERGRPALAAIRAGCKIRKTDTDFNYCRRITANVRAEESPMIKVSVMYPNTPGGRFDHDYYRDKHMPLVKARLG